MDLTNQKVTGLNSVSVQDSLNAALLEIKITAGADVVAPQDNDLIVYVDNQPQSNPSADRKQYVFNLDSVLRAVGSVGDELIEKIVINNNQANLKAYVTRNIEVINSVDTVAQTPTIEDLDAIDITLFEGVNYIYTNYSGVNISITYPKDNDFNRLFINSSIFNRNKELNNDFGLDDIYFKDAFTKMGDELNEEIDNLSCKCFTSKNNTFSMDSQGNLICNSITANSVGSSSGGLTPSDVCDLIYPVGSIYMSVNSVNPSTIFGGTWEQIKDKFLLAAGDTYTNGSSGGEAAHTLSESELPSHTHTIPSLSGTTGGAGAHDHAVIGTSAYWGGSGVFCETWGDKANDRNGYTSAVGDHTHSVTTNASNTGSVGSGSAHNNMPPYLTVNIWKRTA